MLPIAKYEEFHGKPYRKVSGINFHVPHGLVYLGEAVAIEYRCSKRNGGGDGKRSVYRHEFDPGVIVCMDERGKKQLYVMGPRLTVDQAGIRH